jgi:ABC-type transporter Mla subunit MlaD
MHYILVFAIIALIVIIQLRSFINTKQKIRNFLSIFPENSEVYKLQKEALVEKISKEKDNEIVEIEKEKEQEIAKIEAEINNLKIADNDELRNKLNQSDSKFLNDTGEFKLYQVEAARKVLFTRLNNKIIILRKEFDKRVAAKTRERNNAIAKIGNESGILINHNNSTLKTIVGSINDYLKNNKTVSDFHLIKDVVERNCDAKDEEISTQIPIPLYWGLVGTMAGILIGVISLVFSGELSGLLGSEPKGFVKWIVDLFGLEPEGGGIEALFAGVALAMVSSILGISLTTFGSNEFKTAKSQVESNKHVFLSWIQAKLLPTLSDNVVGAIRELTGNLENFNDEFAENTGNLGTAIQKVNESYKMQVQLLDSVRKIADKDITLQNLQLYSALQNCTGEIGKLGDYLQGINQYKAKTNETIDEMHKFLSNGNVQIDSINGKVREALEKFGDDTENYLKNLQLKLDSQIGAVNESIQKQQHELQAHFHNIFNTLSDALKLQNDELLTHFGTVSTQMQTTTNDLQALFKQKLNETSQIVEELKNLTEIKKGVANFEKATKEQNGKIEELTRSIHKLAQKEISGSTILPQMPIWFRIASITVGSLVSVTCLAVLVPLLIEWFTNLFN